MRVGWTGTGWDSPGALGSYCKQASMTGPGLGAERAGTPRLTALPALLVCASSSFLWGTMVLPALALSSDPQPCSFLSGQGLTKTPPKHGTR